MRTVRGRVDGASFLASGDWAARIFRTPEPEKLPVHFPRRQNDGRKLAQNKDVAYLSSINSPPLKRMLSWSRPVNSFEVQQPIADELAAV